MWSARAAGGRLLDETHRRPNATLLPTDAPRLATERITRAALMTNTALQKSGLSIDVRLLITTLSPNEVHSPSKSGGITECCFYDVVVLGIYILYLIAQILGQGFRRNSFKLFVCSNTGQCRGGRSQPEKEYSGPGRHLASLETAFFLNHQLNANMMSTPLFIHTVGTNIRSETLDEAPHRNRCHEAASA